MGVEVKGFFCPSNRTTGSIDLAPIQAQWGTPMPPKAAACDYAFCKGANAGLYWDATKVPAAVRGVFNVSSADAALFYVRLTDVTDGTSTTFAMGEAAGNSTLYPVRSLLWPNLVLDNPQTGRPYLLEQSWSAAGLGDSAHPWYASVFAVTPTRRTSR